MYSVRFRRVRVRRRPRPRPPPPVTTFASHFKTIRAEPSVFGTKKVQVWGNVLDDLSMTLTQGHGCGTN